MKTPPFLIGAALVFWGWQSGFLVPGVVMGLVLEGTRVVRARWELSDEDFFRIWMFCILLLLAATVYSFSANEGPSELRVFFHNSSFLDRKSVV